MELKVIRLLKVGSVGDHRGIETRKAQVPVTGDCRGVRCVKFLDPLRFTDRLNGVITGDGSSTLAEGRIA